MNLYASDIEESYKDKIIYHLGNSGTADLLLHILKCWRAGAVDEEKQYLSMVLYCSDMMYKYYSRLGFTQSNTKRKENIFTMKHPTI